MTHRYRRSSRWTFRGLPENISGGDLAAAVPLAGRPLRGDLQRTGFLKSRFQDSGRNIHIYIYTYMHTAYIYIYV